MISEALYVRAYRKKHKAHFLIIARRWREKRRFGGNRTAALERDGYRCCHCDMTDAESLRQFGVRIGVDHIDGHNDRHPNPNHALSNLQTLCQSCHAKKDAPLVWKRRHIVVTPEVVKMLRDKYFKGNISLGKLAQEHELKRCTVAAIIRRENWKWVK